MIVFSKLDKRNVKRKTSSCNSAMKAVNLCSSQIDSWLGMKKRSYVSHARAAGAAETRDKVVRAAIAFLRHKDLARFSLDAVAKAAGVTRLTVYNQFGSRRGLLEAVFDEIARSGGLHRLGDAMAMPDPRAALDRVVETFSAFWARD